MDMFSSKWGYTINPRTFDRLKPALFRNTEFKTVFNYSFFVVTMNVLKIALFISDVYTCVKLLAFNSWSNNIIKPYLSFRVSKWLFSACILFSIVLLLWELVRGIKVYKTKNIALSYVNNSCRNYYSLKSYSTFCVFEKITTDGHHQSLTFFTFFELKNCFRLLFADTPRQVINGLTLWSVLITTNGTNLKDLVTINGLINKLKYITKSNHEEAVILSFMLFSFIIWCFFIIKFLIALISSVFVYRTLISEGKFSGPREYVCVTVNQKIDELIEKQRSLQEPEKRLQGKASEAELLKRLETYNKSTYRNSELIPNHADQLQEIDYLAGKKFQNSFSDPKFYEFGDDIEANAASDLELLEKHDTSESESSKFDDTGHSVRITSMILDASTNYFKDEIYTFDVPRHMSSTLRNFATESSISEESKRRDIKLSDSFSNQRSHYTQQINFGSMAAAFTDEVKPKKLSRPMPPNIQIDIPHKNLLHMKETFNKSSMQILDEHKIHHNNFIYTPSEAHFDRSDTK